MDMMKWLAGVYVNALNIIHYMHDKYCYESLEMALHDKEVTRWFATGIAGFSVVADSLSAIKYAKVKADPQRAGPGRGLRGRGRLSQVRQRRRPCRRDRQGDRAPLHRTTSESIHTYRDGIHTTSILTITSNVSLWQEYRFHPGWPQGRRALCARCQPHARPR